VFHPSNCFSKTLKPAPIASSIRSCSPQFSLERFATVDSIVCSLDCPQRCTGDARERSTGRAKVRAYHGSQPTQMVLVPLHYEGGYEMPEMADF